MQKVILAVSNRSLRREAVSTSSPTEAVDGDVTATKSH
jgi:hypothetical protein